ncbi:MAG TPA: response regulator [Rhizomicrobium sp.]|nr:response regulator [Rhizomicrobium sp.]
MTAGKAPKTSIHVGIVVGDDAVRDSLQTLLQSHGLTVTSFTSGQEFLSSPLRKSVSCLLVDQQMPGMTGLELVEKLRSKADRTPAILMNASAGEALSQRIKRANIAALLIKPVEQGELLAWIDHIRTLPRWRGENK